MLLPAGWDAAAGRWSRRCGAIVAAVGLTVLAGWWLHLPLLTHILRDRISMKPITAGAFACLGIAIAIANPAGRPWLPGGLAWCAAAAGIGTLLETLTGTTWGFDQWLAAEEPNPVDTLHPGRMAEATAIAFAALGPAAAANAFGRFGTWSRRACWTAAMVGFYILVIHLFGRADFHPWPGLTTMAVHSAFCLLVAAIGLLLTRPGDGALALMLADSPGGAMFRRLLPWAIVLPVLFGWLRLAGEDAGYYDTRFGVAMTTTLLVLSIVGVVFAGARWLHRADARRREAVTFLQGIMDASDSTISVKDADGRYLLLNRRSAEIVGRPVAELVGLRSTDLVPPDEAAKQMAADRRVLASGETTYVESTVRFGGVERIMLIGKTPLRDAHGVPFAVCSISTDITDRHRTARALERTNAELEAVTGKLRESVEELRTFSYSVSHDLRGPLRAIDGFSQALAEDAGDRLDAAARGHLDRIRAGCRRMGELIDGLLALSRVTQAELVRAPVDLTRIGEACVEALRAGDPSRAPEIVVAPGLTVVGDDRLLRAAVANLLANAWKFTSRTPKPRIEFAAFTGADGLRTFYIRDNGAGFDPAYADKLFGPFQRLHARDEFDGTGIGLATTARIIRRHGGRIWAEGEPGRGATFYFTITDGTAAAPGKGHA